MRRIIAIIVAFYLVGLAVVDTVSYNGYYSRIVWNAANYQVYRAYTEFRLILDRVGVTSTAVARP